MSSAERPRIGVFSRWPAGLTAMKSVDAACDQAGLPTRLPTLIRLWCSVLNECQFCIAMHRAEAFKVGVDPAIVTAMTEAQNCESLSLEEQAALKAASVTTRLASQTEIAAAVEALRAHFDANQSVAIGYVIAQINAWNRLAMLDGLTEAHFQHQ
jgi:AhpD family alkylhydroperoxidase